MEHCQQLGALARYRNLQRVSIRVAIRVYFKRQELYLCRTETIAPNSKQLIVSIQMNESVENAWVVGEDVIIKE